jgi:hypothetical protein
MKLSTLLWLVILSLPHTALGADPSPATTNTKSETEEAGNLGEENLPVEKPLRSSPAQRKKAAAPTPPTPFARQYKRELLALLALFVLWWVTRIFQPPETQPQRRSKRHSLLNANEFARVAYTIIQGENVSEYRGLYLTGPEAVRVMGDGAAEVYLHTRTSDVFELAFDQLFDRMPAGARFEKGHLNDKDIIELWVLDPQDERHRIPIGVITHVGAIIRLVSPAVGEDAKTHREHTEDPQQA